MSLRYHEIAETHHRIQNPFSEEKLMQLGEICDLKPSMNQLDLACGKGEMLCRWAEHFGIIGTGVDISPVFLEAARQRAAGLGVSSQVAFHLGDAAQFDAPAESYDIVSCIGANWIGGGTRGTLELIRQKGLKHNPESLVLMGEIFWKESPSDEAIKALGTKRGEWAEGLGQISDWFEDANAHLVEMIIATDDDWDRYEGLAWRTLDRWIIENPEDPELDQITAFAHNCQRNYLKYERPFCSWGVFALRLGW